MEDFTTYSVEQFNSLIGINIKHNDTFNEVMVKIENVNQSYFYTSMNKNDVLQAIEDEREVAKALNLNLIFIDEIGIYIALYE